MVYDAVETITGYSIGTIRYNYGLGDEEYESVKERMKKDGFGGNTGAQLSNEFCSISLNASGYVSTEQRSQVHVSLFYGTEKQDLEDLTITIPSKYNGKIYLKDDKHNDEYYTNKNVIICDKETGYITCLFKPLNTIAFTENIQIKVTARSTENDCIGSSVFTKVTNGIASSTYNASVRQDMNDLFDHMLENGDYITGRTLMEGYIKMQNDRMRRIEQRDKKNIKAVKKNRKGSRR